MAAHEDRLQFESLNARRGWRHPRGRVHCLRTSDMPKSPSKRAGSAEAEVPAPDRSAAILTAAERLFARHGFDAVSIRDIAAEAGVNSALVGYHHGTKEALYRSLFSRRYVDFNAQRLRRLASTSLEPYSKQSLESLVRAWSEPLLMLLRDESHHDFIVLLSRESGDGSADHHGVVREHFDPAARRCMRALGTIYPHLSRDELALYYLWMVNPTVNFIANLQRAARLAGRKMRMQDMLTSSSQQLMVFITEGLHATIMSSRPLLQQAYAR